MFYRALAILLFCTSGCVQSNNSSHSFFKDVDINNLRGIDETNATNFPNIEIFDSSGLIVLIYHVDSKTFFNRIYRHQEKNWVTNFSYSDDTANIYTTRIISPDNFLEFSYTDTVNHKLFDFGILKEDTMRYYNPGRLFFIEPLPENIEKIKENSMDETTYIYDTSGFLTKIIKESSNKQFEAKTSRIECFHKNGRSFFWWLEFQDYMKGIACGNSN